MAWLVGMSDSWVRDRMQAGDLPRPGTTAEEYVEAYVTFRLKKLERDAGDDLDLSAERARLAKEQADEKAMDNAERRRELASLPDMTMAVVGVISMAVSRLMQIPGLVAKGDEKLRKRIEVAVTDALDELSMTRVEEAMGGGVDDDDTPGEDGEE
ncbi:terminase [Sphingomonas naphthae]|uniref:Terminase n=1 Tax=Sphingomonas naphthae TaxID=1813468 RepID=A0ABY7TL52_9SPHN|nr:terminase [Sphingomonas naphthae]WCT73940.1 terminase [Sphingomonas naphthae]